MTILHTNCERLFPVFYDSTLCVLNAENTTEEKKIMTFTPDVLFIPEFGVGVVLEAEILDSANKRGSHPLFVCSRHQICC